jgi:hypothetical protein
VSFIAVPFRCNAGCCFTFSSDRDSGDYNTLLKSENDGFIQTVLCDPVMDARRPRHFAAFEVFSSGSLGLDSVVPGDCHLGIVSGEVRDQDGWLAHRHSLYGENNVKVGHVYIVAVDLVERRVLITDRADPMTVLLNKPLGGMTDPLRFAVAIRTVGYGMRLVRLSGSDRHLDLVSLRDDSSQSEGSAGSYVPSSVVQPFAKPSSDSDDDDDTEDLSG